ncbi:MAG: thiamine pyrophosphate-binding protein [Armatimonadota bacterium]|nr:thiamine pyrophosphate-binding protein [Armatimonadota bacterium]
MKLSDYIFKFIAGQGVKHVFMLPGGGAMHLVDSLGANPDLDYVCNLHEQASAVAAEAYARVTNNLGVALVTTGPGSTNAVTGVVAAWQDSTPCIFISGQVKRSDIASGTGIRQLGVQEIDIVSIVKPITKYAVTIMEPDSIRYHLEKALHLVKSGRPGPAWIDVPLDVQAAEIDETRLKGFDAGELPVRSDAIRLDQAVDQTLALLRQSERPVILAGNGIRISGAQDDFLALVERHGIPALTTRLGVDLIPGSHDLCFGMPGSIASRASNFTLQNSDCLLILGARMDMALIAYAPERLARAAKKIMVNIDEAEIRKLGPIIDVPVPADVGLFIREMLGRSDAPASVSRSAWLDRCKDWRARYPFVLPEHYDTKDGLSLYAFSDILSQEIPEGDVVLPGNSGFAAEIFLTAFKAKRGQRVFHNKGTGAMGFCQPAAIGACLASGRKRTVCVDGDGGFQLNLQELEVVKRLNLPVKFFIINNTGYASIRSSQAGYFGRLTGADATSGLTLPDMVKVAEAYGIPTMRISAGDDVRKAVRSALRSEGPCLIDVMVIPDEPRAPRVAAMKKEDGSMVSKPLEDMWPFLDRDEFLSNMLVEPVEA